MFDVLKKSTIIIQRSSYPTLLLSLFFLFLFAQINAQTIDTYAGQPGGAGYSGDGGYAISARLSYPGRTTVDQFGNLYIPDGNNHVVRKVSASGIISTVAGTGAFGYSGDGGLATAARLWFPNSVAIDSKGNLFILEAVNSVVRKVDAAGKITTVAGNGTKGYSGDGGAATAAQLDNPVDMAIDALDNIYIADKYNKVVRKVNAAGIITTIAGSGVAGYSGDGGPATAAQLTSPDGVAVDNLGNLLIADGQNAVIRKVNTAGIIITIAGNGTYGFTGDGGPATAAQFTVNSPNDLAVDNAGNIYAADYQNHVIRKIDPTGIIITIAGLGQHAGTSGDGGPALAARLWFPTAVTVDACNNLYITDTYNQLVRKISSSSSATVTVQPKDVIVCSNSATSFTIEAVNTATYQWLVNTGAGWVDVPNNVTYTGAKTNTLQITGATPSMNAYTYRCAVANACGVSYSAVATLSIAPTVPPTVSIYTTSTTFCSNYSISFFATPANAGTNPTYQWKKNGVNVGQNSRGYIHENPVTGDIITCTITSIYNCLPINTATSNAITIAVNPVEAPAISITSSTNSVCYGAPITLTATATGAGNNPVYQWKKNGLPVGTNSPTYSSNMFLNNEVITCTVMTRGDCGPPSSATSNSITIILDQGPTPEVTVAATSISICTGDLVTFTATNKSGNPTPIYTWFVDGKEVGAYSTIYSTTTLTNGSEVQCRMTVPQCGGGSTKDYSDPIKIVVNTALNPSISISSDFTNICKNAPVTFKATTAEVGVNPVYQWKINGTNAGTNSKSFTTQNLNDGDVVTCVVIVDATKCFSSSNTTSNSITIKVTTPVRATVNITASVNDICGTKPITFTARTQNAGSTSTYNWLVNGNTLATGNPTFTYNTPVNKDNIQLVVAAANSSCATLSADSSNTITLVVKPVPEIIVSPVDTIVQPGAQVQMRVSIIGNVASYTWSPANAFTNSQNLSPLTLPVLATTTYKLNAVSANGCTTSKEAVLRVVTDLYMPTAFTPNDDGKNDVFRIPPATSITLKEFTVFNRWGAKVFTTRDQQTGWNGKYKGNLSDMGVYIYIISGTDLQGKEVFVKGSVLLMR
ncbi:NHL domain-containing protein [Segetibacter aerophilus]|uniref:Ig-like domain-containing protein n=1 Tax=Segetibacter aerophilus TaxID=670293 RepID=A0A512BGJ0_9BACT|nr:gliding motility-associated C-terminal domain-containing protein [Segetibacter aerophilus]GEO11089.1 hypothetical protein SAE01_35850 [Segetibacter aerophilus]